MTITIPFFPRSLNAEVSYRPILFYVSFLIFHQIAYAQSSSINGRFEADYSTGCSPLKVIITETDTFPSETVRQYDFEGDGIFVGFEPAEEISFTYTQPGSYEIVQIINVDIVPKTDTLFLEVYPPADPDFTILTCENNGAKIEITSDQYQQYRIFFTASDSITINQGEEVPPYTYPAGSHTVRVKGLFIGGKDNCRISSRDFTTIQNLISAKLNEVRMVNKDPLQGIIHLSYELASDVIYRIEVAENFPAGFNIINVLPGQSTSFTIGSIDTENELPIFRISAYDACQEKSIYSDTLSAIILEGVAENDRNRINWEVFPLQFDQFEIFRDNSSESIITVENRREYIDEEVECFTEYCYSIVYTTRKGARSYSDTVCVEAFKIYFPPPIKNTTLSVNDEQIDMDWTPPELQTINSYFIQKRIEDNVYATLDTVAVNQYVDQGADVDSESSCYRISYLDECLNRSNLGDLACSVHLRLEDNRVLTWNDYLGWRNGVKHYIVEVYQEDGTLEEEINLGSGNFYDIQDFIRQQIMKYRIRVESNDDPSLFSFSNFVTKEIEPVLFFPNAFTPNGDGLNDSFKPEGTLMQQFSMKIFNRAGNLLYETDDQENGWDGFYDGKEMPFNTYIYEIEAVDNIGKSFNQTGKVLLIRE